ncbi:MAG: DUF1116 domain-containing protein [Bacilli bacterium]|nr:DUF1116 domain-containing protein [Bacilli bacterium]
METVELVKQANKVAIDKLKDSTIQLIRIRSAKTEVLELSSSTKTLLYAGAPIEFNAMCEVMKQAIYGAIIYENWAKDVHEAEILAASGEVRFLPSETFGFASRGAGIVSPSMPVLVFRNLNSGNHSKITVGQGFKESLDYGYNGSEVILKLKWIERVLQPILNAALVGVRGYNMTALFQKYPDGGREAAQQFGDDLSSLMNELKTDTDSVNEIIDFIQKDTTFYLNAQLATMKATIDSIKNTSFCSFLNSLTSNGVTVGIKLCSSEKWYTVPVKEIKGTFDLNKDLVIGDLYLGDITKDEVHTLANEDNAILFGAEIISSLPGIGFKKIEMVSIPPSVFRIMKREFDDKYAV